MKTYPNQKVIHIQKQKYVDNFLQVGNDEWQRAARELTGSAFKLYLYLAGNKDGYDLALSQKAVENATGLSKNTYHQAVKELSEKGYLSCMKGNVYAFSTTPNEVSTKNGYIPEMGTTQNWEGISPKLGEVSTQNWESILPKTGREIDKTYNIDKIDNEAEDLICPEEKDDGASVAEAEKSPEGKDKSVWVGFIGSDGLPGRRIRDLCREEVQEIKEMLKQGVRYLDIEQQYGMRRGTVTAKFNEHYRMYCQALAAGRV